MRLLIISHTPHYLRDEVYRGWGPTVREIDQLATLFTDVCHLCPAYDGPAPESALPYQNKRVRLKLVKPAGGERLKEKFSVLKVYPRYLRAIMEESSLADVVHVRCPANISLLALLVFSFRKHPKTRWYKYAGDWQDRPSEPWSYRFQRWLLRNRVARGVVTVNGKYPGQRQHVKSFINPCLTDDELQEGRLRAQDKAPPQPLRLLFVGAMDANKGVLRAAEIWQRLLALGISTTLEIVGDGEQRQQLERQVTGKGGVTVHGWKPRNELGEIYSRSHVLLVPSRTEGWPKVMSEAMAYGVVPVASAISCIPQYLQEFRSGRTVSAGEISEFVTACEDYATEPGKWAEESRLATGAAERFTYNAYLADVRHLLNLSEPGPCMATN